MRTISTAETYENIMFLLGKKGMAMIQTVNCSQYGPKANAIQGSVNGAFVHCNSIGSFTLFARYTVLGQSQKNAWTNQHDNTRTCVFTSQLSIGTTDMLFRENLESQDELRDLITDGNYKELKGCQYR